MKPNIVIFNAETQEEVLREMNDEEYAQHLIDMQNFEINWAERDAKNAEKDAVKAALQEKLAEMNITPELIEVIKKL